MIYRKDIDEMITRLIEQKVDVYGGDYVIVAHPFTSFEFELLPLEIVTSVRCPMFMAYIIKRPAI